jgi:hypothetical protein
MRVLQKTKPQRKHRVLSKNFLLLLSLRGIAKRSRAIRSNLCGVYTQDLFKEIASHAFGIARNDVEGAEPPEKTEKIS